MRLGGNKKQGRIRRWFVQLMLLLILVVLGTSSDAADYSKNFAGLCGRKSSVMNYIQNTFSKNAILAGSPEAQMAYLGVLAAESNFVPGRASYNDSSFGLGQINYLTHQQAISDAIFSSTGQRLSTVKVVTVIDSNGNKKSVADPARYNEYAANKAIAADWLKTHHQEALDLAANVYTDSLQRALKSGKSLDDAIAYAINAYCGGCDPNYMDKVQFAMKMLADCGDGTGIYVIQPQNADGTPAGPPLLLRCPNLDMVKALGDAGKYFAGVQSVRSADGWQSLMTYFSQEKTKQKAGPFSTKFCIDRITTDYFTALRELLNPVALIINKLQTLLMSLLNQACEAVITAINNALSSVCIPLPNLNLDLNLGLDGMERKSCDGISLASIFKVSQQGMGGNISDVANALTGKNFAPWQPEKKMMDIVRDVVEGDGTTQSGGQSSTYSKN